MDEKNVKKLLTACVVAYVVFLVYLATANERQQRWLREKYEAATNVFRSDDDDEVAGFSQVISDN